ncbi:MAG: ECF transporter S component [Lachnospiraceae bacterium]|nr:ECF transporter S component [Lachnospiraceae bacterium]
MQRRNVRARRVKAREVVMIAILSAITVLGDLLSFPILPIQAGTGMVIISGIAFGPVVGVIVGMLARFIANFFTGQGIWTIWQMFAWGLLGLIAGVVFSKIDIEKPRSRDFKVLIGPVSAVLFMEVLAYISYLVWPNSEATFIGWRLYVFGFVGLIIGAIIQRKRMPADDVTLAVFTLFVVFIIYGGIMNLGTLFMSSMSAADLSLDALKALYITGAPFDLWHAVRAAVFVFIFGNTILVKLERVKIKYGFYRVRQV